MKTLFAIQHTESEFLGLIEDHLEGRGIRFQYVRPFVAGGAVPGTAIHTDGLFLLGGGPWGAAGGRDVPSLAAELRLTKDFLKRRRPVVGFGLGAQILCLAAGGGSRPGPVEFSLLRCRRLGGDALNGFLPEEFPLAVYMRDWPVPPADARVLAVDEAGRPAAFEINGNSFGFVGHPGCKPGMLEDLVMEFDETPEDCAGPLERVRTAQDEIQATLGPLMTGLVQRTGLMRPQDEAELRRRSFIPLVPR